jgi:N-acetyl-anhydromuramyl-L-alanine amidase AmpD
VNYTGADGEPTAYCQFDSASNFIRGYWQFITSPAAPYSHWANYANDSKAYIRYIAESGYCPLKDYPNNVIGVFDEAARLLGKPQSETAQGSASKGIPSAPAGTAAKPSWHDELPAKFLNRRSSPIQGIVLHDTAGSGTHNDTRYLANPEDGRKVSVDFTVEKDGSIWKLNPDLQSYYCNHAGRNTEWLGFKNAQVNAVTVGIEIVQKDNLGNPPYYPDAQVAAVGSLCAWLCVKFGFNNSRITTHRQIITDGSRSDPRKFPFDEFWSTYWAALGKGDKFAASMSGRDDDDGLEMASADTTELIDDV